MLFDIGYNYVVFNVELWLGCILQWVFVMYLCDGLVIFSKVGILIGQVGISGVEQCDFFFVVIECSCVVLLCNLYCDYLDIFQFYGIGLEQISDELLIVLECMWCSGMFWLFGINIYIGVVM